MLGEDAHALSPTCAGGVRPGVRRAADERLLHAHPLTGSGQGSVLVGISRDDMHNLYMLYIALEPLAETPIAG